MLIELVVLCAALAGCVEDAGADPPKPPDVVATLVEPPKVEWAGLAVSSMRFLGVMHAFRLATEPGTRAGGFGLGRDYFRGLGNLHGWADGDPAYVNFVGHPMQGAVSGYLWLLHDQRYRRTEFGAGPDYWKGKLRAAAFAWAFSEQFEIGALSENSIGHIQKDFPQQGFVDHVVTPAVGLGWMIGEDALDRWVVKRIEGCTQNPYARIFARSLLNPARSFANMMDWKVPWYRDTRAGVLAYEPSAVSTPRAPAVEAPSVRAIAPFEFTATAGARLFGNDVACVGGGAEGTFRVAPDLQMVLSVNGCKMTGLPENVSGDALVYQVGPRWTPSPSGKWSPFAHLLIGGIKITEETLDPAEKKHVLEANQDLDPMLDYTLHGRYTSEKESNRLAVTAGIGLDYRLNPALAIRVASFEYLRGGGSPAGRGFQMTTGMVLRWGTW